MSDEKMTVDSVDFMAELVTLRAEMKSATKKLNDVEFELTKKLDSALDEVKENGKHCAELRRHVDKVTAGVSHSLFDLYLMF
jgi:hypothetical protein